jgi:hypothetical protein
MELADAKIKVRINFYIKLITSGTNNQMFDKVLLIRGIKYNKFQ